MGKRTFRPQRVLRAANQLLEAKVLTSKPPWHASLEKIPPSKILVRPIKQRPLTHEEEESLLRPGQRINPSRVRMRQELRTPKTWQEMTAAAGAEQRAEGRGWYKPKAISYPEDGLRYEFFGDHPWELARPRVVLEGKGGDSNGLDWGRGVMQRGKQLDGESVVQRQMWLMQHAGMTKPAAYDKARKEFYQVRREQEIERRVAQEEALHYGAYFGKSTLEIGEELEDDVWEKWKERAVVHMEQLQNRRQQVVTFVSEEKEGEDEESVDEIQDVPPEAAGQPPARKLNAGQLAFGGTPVRPMASPPSRR